MDELTIGDKVYISSKRAAKITGYAKDYVGQLCREGRVEARLVGRNWYVLEASILEHRFGVAEEAASNAPAVQEVESSDSWSQPVYMPEVQEPVVPVLLKNPDTESAKRVVSEMQSAWQEWFATQAVEPSTTSTEETSKEQDEIATEVELQEEPVHISRLPDEHQEVPAEDYAAPSTKEADYDYDMAPTAKTIEYVHNAGTERRGGGFPFYSLAKISLILITVVSIVAAVLGSGVVGDLLLHSYRLDGWTLETVQYLGGETEFINR